MVEKLLQQLNQQLLRAQREEYVLLCPDDAWRKTYGPIMFKNVEYTGQIGARVVKEVDEKSLDDRPIPLVTEVTLVDGLHTSLFRFEGDVDLPEKEYVTVLGTRSAQMHPPFIEYFGDEAVLSYQIGSLEKLLDQKEPAWAYAVIKSDHLWYHDALQYELLADLKWRIQQSEDSPLFISAN